MGAPALGGRGSRSGCYSRIKMSSTAHKASCRRVFSQPICVLHCLSRPGSFGLPSEHSPQRLLQACSFVLLRGSSSSFFAPPGPSSGSLRSLPRPLHGFLQRLLQRFSSAAQRLRVPTTSSASRNVQRPSGRMASDDRQTTGRTAMQMSGSRGLARQQCSVL